MAWGDDYQTYCGESLMRLWKSLRERFTGPFERALTLNGPVQERVLRNMPGLGCSGKTTLLC